MPYFDFIGKIEFCSVLELLLMGSSIYDHISARTKMTFPIVLFAYMRAAYGGHHPRVKWPFWDKDSTTKFLESFERCDFGLRSYLVRKIRTRANNLAIRKLYETRVRKGDRERPWALLKFTAVATR